MREAAVDTAASALVAPSLNSRVNWSIIAAWRCLASCSAAFSAAAALASTMPSRNTDSASAIWPISSPPRLVSTSAERSPRGQPRHGLLQTDQPRHQIAADIEPDEQSGAEHADRRDHQHHEGAEADGLIGAVGRFLGLVGDGLDLAGDFAGEFIGEAAGLLEQLLPELAGGNLLAARVEDGVAGAELEPGFGRLAQAFASAAACRRYRASPRPAPTIALKFFSSAATLSASGATAARSSRLDARLTKPTRSANPCDTGTWVETSFNSVIIDWLASPPMVIETMVMSAWAFSPAGSSTSLSLVWAACAALTTSSPWRAELEAIVDRAIQRRRAWCSSSEISVFSWSIDSLSDRVPAMASSRLAMPSCRAFSVGEFLLPLRLRLGRKQRRRGAGQRLGFGLQSQRLDDLGNVAAGDAVEEIAHLREHQPGGGAGDDGGSRYRRKGEEQLGPDSELATVRFSRSRLPLFFERAGLTWRQPCIAGSAPWRACTGARRRCRAWPCWLSIPRPPAR